ncbi:MFS transporter [Mucilaginibacter koreensis]
MPRLPNPFRIYASTYNGLSANSWHLSLVMLINRSGTMVIPFMTIYCTQQLHFSITQAGYIMALFGAGSIAGAFLGGRLTDKLGFYSVQLMALISGGLLYMLLGYQKTFATLGIGTFILSVCNEAFRPANSAAIAHYSSPETTTRSYSLNRLAINLGWAFGGAVGGFLAAIDYHLLFWVDGCTNLFAALILIKVLPFSAVKTIKTQVKAIADEMRSPYQDRTYLMFIALIVLYAACFFQMFTLQPEFFKTQWHLSERVIGALMGFNGLLIALIEMPLVYYMDGKKHPLIYIALGTVVIGIGYAVQNVLPAGIVVAVISIILLSVGEIISMPFMNSFWVARTTPANRGQYAALYTMAWSLAPIVAPTIGSQLVLHASYSALWYVVGTACCAGALGTLALYRSISKTKVASSLS